MMGMFLIIFRKMSGGEESMQIETCSTNTFKDVAGLDEIKESMMTTVDMLKHPDKYAAAGARISKGVLLYGPPGTGKTLLAKAIAGEAGTNFLAVNGADFEHKYVGVGADKVRKIFERAKKLAPCIIFIDELDAVGCKRTDSDKSFERQTLNQLLSCMDGFSASDGVFVFAATNNIESLDSALLRPGRFDSRYAVGIPDTAKDRAAIIELYLKNKKIDETVSIESLAKQTLGCSPAMIEAVINEAAIESVKNGGIINQTNIDEAFYRQLMDGHKRKTSDRDEQEIKTVAWHEAGHALVGYFTNEEVTKISIVPTTSGAGGVTIFNQKKLGLYSKEELENHIKTLYAGRNAEIILNGAAGVTTGASNDIKEATKCIKGMVDAYGMSDYGPLDLTQFNISSDDLFKEYKKISTSLSDASMTILQDHKDLLVKLANVLIEKESIGEDELKEIFQNATSVEQ
jgi:cell division protease FtsH